MNNLAYKFFYQRNLPHVQPPGATLFVTFRLVNSIPVEILLQLQVEAKRVKTILSDITNFQERTERAYLEQRRLFGKWDKALDTAQTGPVWLHDPQIAELIVGSIHHRDGRVYDLDAFCVMPNHVHMVFTPLQKGETTEDEKSYYALPAIMHSLKLYTGRRANLFLKREGKFWRHENYDHVVRDDAEWERIVNYVLNNPVKAGLVQHWEEWSWSYCKYM